MKGYLVFGGYMGYLPSLKGYMLFPTQNEYEEYYDEKEAQIFQVSDIFPFLL